MNKFQKLCSIFLKVFIGIALIQIYKKAKVVVNFEHDDILFKKFMPIIILSIFTGILTISSNLSKKIKIFLLLFITFLIRIWWNINVNSVPVSDFESMYSCAKDLLNGDLTEFRGVGYLSRFPHLICTTLYMALMILVFPTFHLTAIKIVNIILSVVTAFLLYKLSEKFIKNEKFKLSVILAAAVFPPFISYSSTYCTENLAIPFYLLTMIVFFKAIKSNNFVTWILCGIFLGTSNLFRGVAMVFLIAFVIYILVYTSKNKIKNSCGIIGGMLFISLTISMLLISVNIINKPLWMGAEPSIATLFLKGCNVDNGGRWNVEDAKFVEDNLGNPALSEMCIEKGINRITKLSFNEIKKFYSDKFLSQWSVGDFSGTFWAFLETDLKLNQATLVDFQKIYIVILIFSFISLLNIKSKKCNSLLYILLCGFGLMFMIIETQSRYSYIISWVFIILAVQGIENIMGCVRRLKDVKYIKKI